MVVSICNSYLLLLFHSVTHQRLLVWDDPWTSLGDHEYSC